MVRKLLIFVLLPLILFAGNSASWQPETAKAETWTNFTGSGFADGGITVTPVVEFFNGLLVATTKKVGNNHFTEIWRTTKGATPSWGRVASDGLAGDLAAPDNTALAMSFRTFGTDLYLLSDMKATNQNVCSLNGGTVQNNSCQIVWKSDDGVVWEHAAPPNFSGVSVTPTLIKSGMDLVPESLHHGGDLIVFQGNLYAAPVKYAFDAGGFQGCQKAELFKLVGSTWERAFTGNGQGDGIGRSGTCGIGSMIEYRNQLYLSTLRDPATSVKSEVFRSPDGVTWQGVRTDSFDEGALVTQMSTLNDELYVATRYTDNRPAGIWKYNGSNWNKQVNNGFGSSNNKAITAFQNLDGYQILAGTYNTVDGTQIFRSSDGINWVPLNAGNSGFGTNQNFAVGGFTLVGTDWYATTWNNSGMQIWRTSSVAPPPVQCSLDLMIAIDLSDSMDFLLVNSVKSKIQAAVDAIVGSTENGVYRPGIVDILRGTGSRIAVVGFKYDNRSQYRSVLFNFNGQGHDFAPVTGTDLYISRLKADIANLVNDTKGGTPMAGGLNEAWNIIKDSRTDTDGNSGLLIANTPRLLVLSDGMPTVDLQERTYQDADTDQVTVNDGTPAGFKTEAQVRSSGVSYAQYGTRAGEPIADVMHVAKQVVSPASSPNLSNMTIFSVFLRSAISSNIDVLRYLGYVDSGAPTSYNTVLPSDDAQLKEEFNRFIGIEACKATLTIDLPPSSVFTPNKLVFGANEYTFSTTDGPHFDRTSGSEDIEVDIRRIAVDGATPIVDFYQILIKDFRRNGGINAGNYPYKLTFGNLPVTNGTLNQLEPYLSANNGLNNVFLGSNDCARNSSGSHICFKTTAALHVPTPPGIDNIPDQKVTAFEKILRQQIDIVVEGNVAGSNTSRVNDFFLQDNTVAVGGTITVRGNPTRLSGYQATVFNWDNVSAKLGEKFSQGLTAGSAVAGGTYNNLRWNLNSATIPSGLANSFSSSPEGKIWAVNGDVTFNGQTTFTGSGTIVVNGNVTFAGPVTCQDQRLGIIARGTITFNTNRVECGAYLALGQVGTGNIAFQNALSGNITGIFIARNSVDLPSRTGLTGTYAINYDAVFARNPTALFRDILAEIFYTTS